MEIEEFKTKLNLTQQKIQKLVQEHLTQLENETGVSVTGVGVLRSDITPIGNNKVKNLVTDCIIEYDL